MTRVTTIAGGLRGGEAPRIVAALRLFRSLAKQKLMKTADVFLPVISVALIYLVRVIELGTKRDTVPGPIRERVTLRLFILAGTLMVVGGTIEFWVRRRTLNGWTFGAGWICALASFVVRRKAISALGKFWSLHVEIRENHQFVQTGPFRWVRHPTYLSMILELASVGLILDAPGALLFVSLLFVPALVMRLQLEEAALVEKFGDAYRIYQRTTPALLPYKFPRAK